MKSNAIKGIKTDYSVAKTAAQKKVKAKFDAAKAKIAALEKDAEGYVSDNPKKAVAIAAGIGALIGAASVAFLMKGKKGKKVDSKKAKGEN